MVYKCSCCPKLEYAFLFNDGHIVIGKPINQPDESNTPLGMGNYVHNGRAVKNAGAKSNHHTKKINIQDILKFEHPAKFESPEQMEQFKRNFPALKEDFFAALDKNAGKKGVRTLFNPGKCGHIQPILPLIKEISGCEVNVRRHHTSVKLFSKLKEHELVVSYALACR